MHQYGLENAGVYEEPAYFACSEGTFPMDDSSNANRTPFIGIDDCLDHQLHKAPAYTSGLNELNPNGDPDQDGLNAQDHQQQPLEFHDLEDNGQLLNEMLHQQHQQQQQHPQYHHQQQDGMLHNIAPSSSSQQQSAAAASWEESIQLLQEMLLLQQHQALQCPPMFTDPPSPNIPSTLAFSNPVPATMSSNISSHSFSKFPGESELLSLLQLPRCASTSMSNSIDCRKLPINYNPSPCHDHLANYHNVSVDYDPHLLLKQQPSQTSTLSYQVSLKQLFQNASQGPHPNASTSSTLVHHLVGDEKEANTFNLDDARHFGGPIFDFKRVDATKGEPRGINHFATERQRREYLNEKYQTLRSLVPNPTKCAGGPCFHRAGRD